MLILLLISIITFYGLYLWFLGRKYSHLPAYLGNEFPFIGNLYCSVKNSFLSHDEIQALLEQLLPPGGGFCVIWLYCLPVLAVSDPALLQKLAEHPDFADKDPLVYENTTNLWKGTFTYANSDSKWKQRRKIINHSLKKQNMMNYHNTFIKMSKRMVDRMEREKSPVNVENYSVMSTLDSVIETHFGCDLNVMDDKELFKVIHWGMKEIPKTFFNPIFGFIMNGVLAVTNIMKPFHRIVDILVKNALDKQQNLKEDENQNLYVEALLQQYPSIDKNYKEIRKEIIEMMLVGSHTVGLFVSSTLVFLATLPEIQEKVWQEQQDIFGDSDRDPTFEDVKNMVYLERVLKEVLRFISGPALARRTRGEINIDGIVIPSNTTVMMCTRLMRIDDHHWKNPSVFNPDRYLENEPDSSYKQAFTFFGYGNRNCPGSQYSYNEGKIMVSTVVRRFKLVSDRRFEDLKFSSQIMVEIKDGYDISLEKRIK